MKKYNQYKNSGVEWLGEIPEHWKILSLKRVLIHNDGGVWNENFSDLGVPVYRSTEINIDGTWNDSEPIKLILSDKELEKVCLKKGDLIVTKSSGSPEHIGKTAIYDKDEIAAYSNFTQRIRFEIKENNPSYYFYVLNSNISKLQYKVLTKSTSGLGNLNAEILGNIVTVNPPLNEQKLIVSFLKRKTTEINQAINIKLKQIELLKERRQIIIHNAITKGLNKTVKFKDSGAEWIGEIPEHWKVETLKNILTERNEKNSPIRTREILSLSIDKGVTLYAEKTTNLDRFKDDFSQYKLTHKGDLVFNSMNMIVGAVGVSDYFGCVSPVYYTYYGRHNYSNTKFYEYLFRCKTIQGVLYSLGKGLIAIDRGEGKYNTLRLKVSRDDLRSMRLPFPSYSEQNQIISYIETQSSKIDSLISLKEQEIEKLKEYKVSLIDGVVTGKVKVF